MATRHATLEISLRKQIPASTQPFTCGRTDLFKQKVSRDTFPMNNFAFYYCSFHYSHVLLATDLVGFFCNPHWRKPTRWESFELYNFKLAPGLDSKHFLHNTFEQNWLYVSYSPRAMSWNKSTFAHRYCIGRRTVRNEKPLRTSSDYLTAALDRLHVSSWQIARGLVPLKVGPLWPKHGTYKLWDNQALLRMPQSDPLSTSLATIHYHHFYSTIHPRLETTSY